MTNMEIVAVGIGGLFVLLMLILIGLVIFLIARIRKIGEGGENASQIAPQLAVINEKLSTMERLNQAVGGLQVDLRGLSERITTVENNQNQVKQGVSYLATNTVSSIKELQTLTNNLQEATRAMSSDLSLAKNDLTELHAHVKSGQDLERQVAESIRRLETIIAGTQSKGAAGENIIEVVFAKLPPEWQVRNFKISGKTVEFGLRLPNNLIMPIDSKWTATHLVEEFIQSEDIQEQMRLKKEIESAVLEKAGEVRKYIDPSVTVNFGVAVVPDAVYDLCAGIQPEIFRLNVVILSYSMFVPYLLLVFQTTLKSSQHLDLQRVEAYLQSAQSTLEDINDELEGRFSRALTMLNNSRDDLRTLLSSLSSNLTGLLLGAGAAAAELPEPEADADALDPPTGG